MYYNQWNITAEDLNSSHTPNSWELSGLHSDSVSGCRPWGAGEAVAAADPCSDSGKSRRARRDEWVECNEEEEKEEEERVRGRKEGRKEDSASNNSLCMGEIWEGEGFVVKGKEEGCSWISGGSQEDQKGVAELKMKKYPFKIIFRDNDLTN